MRLANLHGRAAIAVDELAIDVGRASSGRFGPRIDGLYDEWDAFRDWAADVSPRDGESFDVAALESPVVAPRQIIAVGLNYSEHAHEAGMAIPDGLPPVFAKFVSALTGPYSDVELPPGKVDWEVELAAVIGRRAHRLSASEGWSVVAGLTVAQDLSERDLQMSGPAPQFGLAKSYPGFLPLGPYLVTPDELGDRDALRLRAELNGDLVQDGNTSQMILSVPDMVERLSQILTLFPGDVILTGTPAGVGMALDPPRYIAPGDLLVSTIDGIGSIRQRFLTGS